MVGDNTDHRLKALDVGWGRVALALVLRFEATSPSAQYFR